MQAIILAAGMGKRLKELTKNNTKCMVKINGVTLIDRMLHQIEKYRLSKIVIIVGYEGRKLMDYIATLNIKTPIIFIENPIYDKTNNIYSLSLAKDYLRQEDTLLFESDLIFEDAILDELIKDPRETLALVDKFEMWMDGTCVRLSQDDTINSFIPGKQVKFGETEENYKTVNIYKFSKQFSETYYVPFLEAYQQALGQNEYYEQVLRVITMLNISDIKAKRLNGQKWYEIDDIQDLDIAESIFAPDEQEKVSLIQRRFGGYWRYPSLLDFCYLVNPYFPPARMIEEIKANLDTLIRQYPSGMRVNSLLAAKNFNVDQKNILVGNGAAELIKSLMGSLAGGVGIIRPTFEEYPHRYDEKDVVAYWPQNDTCSYTAEDLIAWFQTKDIKTMVVVNPDNPSGNYLDKKDIQRLIAWTGEAGVRLVVDESFADFADEENNTLFKQPVLDANPHLFVMKSISKSYGVPGVRLGVLASGDTALIAAMKKDVAIWNINSIAEYYLQIEGKYEKDYTNALARFKAERARYQRELAAVKGLHVIPSQANYLMVEICSGMSAGELTRIMLSRHNMLIKDLTGKMNGTGKQYIRLAVRNTEDNDRLVAALKEELSR